MQPDDQPYCGEELLPHATAPDGTPAPIPRTHPPHPSSAPILCTLPVHSRYVMHQNDEHMTRWRWQDADGNWLSRPATDYPA